MRPEGIRRLSILLGVLGFSGWIIFVIIATEGFRGAKNYEAITWLFIIAGLPICYFVPLGLVRGIAWVVEGFNHDKNRP